MTGGLSKAQRLAAWHEFEQIVEYHCQRALVEAQEAGEPVTAYICAGPPWCYDDRAGCVWCTRIAVYPDGSRIRQEPHHA